MRRIDTAALLWPPALQTRIVANAQDADGEVVTSSVMVNTAKFLSASPEGIEGLCGLLQAAVLTRGGDILRIAYTAEPVGPQIALVAVDGERI